MNKSFQRQKSRNARMDSISAPDISKIKALNEPKISGNKVNRTADEIFEGEKFNKVGKFDRATLAYSDPVRLKHDYEQEEQDDLMAGAAPRRKQAPGVWDKGVKVGSSYVTRKKVVFWTVFVLILLVLMLIFLPPTVSPVDEETKVLYDKDVFCDMGMTEFKTYALSNFSVWNEESFSSENKSNYRVVNIAVKISNPTPFEVVIPQYEVANADTLYEEKICYVTATKTDDKGVVIGDTIPAFGSEVVNIEVMVNITDLDDDDFDEAITSLVLKSSGLKKKIAGDKYIPGIPEFIFVANTIEVSVNP